MILDDNYIKLEKQKIDKMSQVEMASLWRFAPSGHPYFVRDSPLSEYFLSKFKGFTPSISKILGLE